MEEFLTIRESDLRELLKFQARGLVGKLLKRFEIHTNPEVIKKEAKELVYESFRQVEDLVYSYDKGITAVRQFKFTKDETQETAPATE